MVTLRLQPTLPQQGFLKIFFLTQDNNDTKLKSDKGAGNGTFIFLSLKCSTSTATASFLHLRHATD